MHAAAPSVSIVVPCYNEELVLDALHDRLLRVCEQLGESSEIILVNDGSADATWPRLLELAATNPRLVCVNLSRNHGQQLALTAGLSVARGSKMLLLDADLQDPPELLPDMLALMAREEADVVYGQRASRDGETLFKKWTAHIYYRLLGWVADGSIPRDTGDFRLVSRRVVDQFLAMPERHRFLRGMLSWIGHKQVPIRYERQAREAGTTKYTFKKMYRLAWDGITGFSVKPLTLAMRAGGVCLAASGFTLLLAAAWSWQNAAIPTIGLLTALIFLLSGGQFLAIGIIGEYLGRVFNEVRGRPLFIIDQVVRGKPALAEMPRREVA